MNTMICAPVANNDEKEEKNETMLWTMSNQVTITQDKYITCKNDGKWHQIGINHTINQSNDIKTSWLIKIGSSCPIGVMMGMATKDIVSQKHCYAGSFMYGWTYASNGHYYHGGKYQLMTNEHVKFQYNCGLKWAPNDEIKIEFCNYTLKLFIDDVEVHKWKINQYPKLKNKKLIPVICIRLDSKCEFFGVTQQ